MPNGDDFCGSIQFYENSFKEKSFSIRCMAHVLTLVVNRQVVQDHLNLLFFCNKLETIYSNQVQKKTNLLHF